MNSKQALRKALRMQRDRLAPQERANASALITENVVWMAGDAKNIGIYLSFSSEVDTIDAIATWLWEDKNIYVPRMQGDDFQWVKLTDFKSFAVNSLGICEPLEGEIVETAALDLIFVPLLGFDDVHHRIGYGKGCYDRALKGYTGLKVGLCYAMGYVETTYPSEHDIPLDVIITEKEIFSLHR